MARLLFGTLAVALVASLAPAGGGGEDVRQLQGTWVVASGEKGGKKGEGPDFKTFAARFRLTIEGNKYHSSGPGSDQDAEGTFRVDASRKPKHITFTRKDGKQNKSIYDFRGGMLWLCSGRPGDPRPTGFKTEKGSPAILLVLTRKGK